MSQANKKQFGGAHYKQPDGGEEHWDRQWRLSGAGYFIGCITKYVERYRSKNGLQDLQKSQHFLEKLIELETSPTGHYRAESIVDHGDLIADFAGHQKTMPKIFVQPDTGHPDSRPVNVNWYTPGQILPTGWAQFTFEGAYAEGFLFTCRECNAHFTCPPHSNPHATHECHSIADGFAPLGAATPAYVDQD